MNYLKALSALSNPRYWRAIRNGVIPTLEHRPPLGHLNPGTVIDIGANKGQFSTFATRMWPSAKVYAFEPLPGPIKTLRKVLGNDVELRTVALGDTKSELDIHIASRADSSSLLPLGSKQKDLFNMDEVGTLLVPVERLDTEIKESDLIGPVLVKIDVQGYEYQALKGATGILPSIDFIYVEASFQELYEGQDLFPAVDELLTENGFIQSGQFNPAKDDNGALIQADILYRRA